jgi:pyruvate-ferredoxin/flavodoxin oxidoreductase
MIPIMFKIAGELTPATMHVTARTLATHALSIFGDHSDVMACRSTGWAMLCSNSVQEVADMALVAQIATLESRIPFIHFFDGFRTSHEVGKILPISDETIRAMVDDKYIIDYRKNALSSDRPIIRGTAQNPDVFFQAREACSPFHAAVPAIVQSVMDRFAAQSGRAYHLFDYYGAPDAERVIVLMGSGAEAAEEAVDLMVKQGEKIGMVKVRLYRPFDAKAFLASMPASVKSIAVLDRCKEPGGAGEPLYQDILTVLAENSANLPFAAMPKVVGGRYGLSSKEPLHHRH